ncbi:hypothetical protein BJ170DRAFT_695738, partial [Xylariales sp. AK1849]
RGIVCPSSQLSPVVVQYLPTYLPTYLLEGSPQKKKQPVSDPSQTGRQTTRPHNKSATFLAPARNQEYRQTPEAYHRLHNGLHCRYWFSRLSGDKDYLRITINQIQQALKSECFSSTSSPRWLSSFIVPRKLDTRLFRLGKSHPSRSTFCTARLPLSPSPRATIFPGVYLQPAIVSGRVLCLCRLTCICTVLPHIAFTDGYPISLARSAHYLDYPPFQQLGN